MNLYGVTGGKQMIAERKECGDELWSGHTHFSQLINVMLDRSSIAARPTRVEDAFDGKLDF